MTRANCASPSLDVPQNSFLVIQEPLQSSVADPTEKPSNALPTTTFSRTTGMIVVYRESPCSGLSRANSTVSILCIKHVLVLPRSDPVVILQVVHRCLVGRRFRPTGLHGNVVAFQAAGSIPRLAISISTHLTQWLVLATHSTSHMPMITEMITEVDTDRE